jgi:hypothetical protein
MNTDQRLSERRMARISAKKTRPVIGVDPQFASSSLLYPCKSVFIRDLKMNVIKKTKHGSSPNP